MNFDDTGVFANKGDAIPVLSGSQFSLLNPPVDKIDIEDIAHATANLCRFTGHTRAFYSVAQHCVIVSRLVPSELALTGLLHDATEAYIGDVSRPLKNALGGEHSALTLIEMRLHEAIAERFEIEWPFPPAIKQADNVALATEKRDLLTSHPGVWKGLPEPAPWAIVPLDPYQARNQFLARFVEISLHPGRGQAPVRKQPDPKRRETTKETSARLAREEEDEKSRWEVIG